MLEICGGILIAWLIAEIGSGIFHWVEDQYGNPEWEHSKSKLKRFIYHNVIGPNVTHHKTPAAMLKGNFWHRNNTSIIPAFSLALIAYFLWPTYWPVWSGLILMGFSNEIHGWCHTKSSAHIRFLQSICILQSPKHHKIHHTRPYSNNYCVMSGWVNPILNFFFFWEMLRGLVWLCTGLRPLEIREKD